MVWRKGYFYRWLGLLLAVVLVLGTVLPAAAAPRPFSRQTQEHVGTRQGYVPGEVIVKFKDDAVKGKSLAAAAVDFAAAHGALGLRMARALPHGAGLFKTTADVPQAVERLKSDPRVAYAQPNFIYRCCAVSDPLVSWGITDAVYGVQAETAWQYTCGSPNVVVAVLDSGVDYNHPDLQGQVIRGYDYVNNDPDPMDDNGHGTHVAGIIAATLNNNEGVAGVAPGAKVMAVKVLGADGSGTTASVVDGINYAASHGAKVVNMSFAGLPGSPPPCEGDKCLYEAIKAYPGVLFVAAAGNNEANNNDESPVWPAGFTKDWPNYGITALPNIIAVAALAQNGALASFSNYGATSVGLAAPGENIWSTIPAPPAGGGVALAVYDAVYGYKVMFWGFGAEDLDDPSGGTSTTGAVYDSIIRTVYDFFGVTPADTQGTTGKPLLVVDDDQDGTYGTSPNQWTLPDVSSYYLNALSTAGYVYTLYTVPNGSDGPAVDASVYSGVIWFTGYSDDSLPGSSDIDPPNLTTADQANLITYLKAGGKLFLCGRDAGWGIEETDFYRQYLGAEFINESKGPSVISAVYEPFTGATYQLSPDRLYIDILKPARVGANAVLSFNPYEAWSGTSMAAPFVSGAAALALSLRGDLPPAQVIGILKGQVTPLPALAGKVASGGTLNAAKVVAYVCSLPPPGGGAGGGGGGGGGGGAAPPKKEELPTGTAVVTATGGQQTAVLLDGRVTLALPAGALPKETRVTVKLAADIPEKPPAGALAVTPVISIESASAPAKPVKVGFTLDPAKLGSLDPRACLVFRQETDGTWQPVGGRFDPGANRVVVELDHFSNYAVFGLRKEFSDTTGHWAAKEISVLAARNVIAGYPDGSFKPEKPLTRAELAALLAGFLSLKATETTSAFGDVPPDAWYAGAVAAVREKGLMSGAGGRFRPNDTLTRQELAAVALRLAGLSVQDLTPTFADAAEIAPWARQAVATAAAAGLVKGVGNERFAPKAPVTRAQMATILYRLAERLGLYTETVTVTGKLTLSTIEKPHWELVAEKETYVLLFDQADRLTANLVRANEGKMMTVTGYLETGPNIYMRGPILRVLSVKPAET